MRDVDIRQLVEKFFNGDTSLEEEQTLYGFFSGDDIPEDLKEYKNVFSGFALLPLDKEAVTKTEEAASGILSSGSSKKAKRAMFRKLRIAMTAASAAAVTCLMVFAYTDLREYDMLARTYEGSYVIENGKRTDNIREIKDDIKEAVKNADKVEKNVNSQDSADKMEEDMLKSIDDPAERQRIRNLLN